MLGQAQRNRLGQMTRMKWPVWRSVTVIMYAINQPQALVLHTLEDITYIATLPHKVPLAKHQTETGSQTQTQMQAQRCIHLGHQIRRDVT